MKRKLTVIGSLLLLAVMLAGCSGSGLTSDTIAGNWFCQLGEDGGLLENEYDYYLEADGTYKFIYTYLALGVKDINNSGIETGTWEYSEADVKLTFTPDSGSAYSFEITTLVYPKTRLYWTDLNGKLETVTGVSQGQDGVFTFDLY